MMQPKTNHVHKWEPSKQVIEAIEQYLELVFLHSLINICVGLLLQCHKITQVLGDYDKLYQPPTINSI